MEKTPKSLRLQIGIFGRTNVGKSSFLNYVTSQSVAITSEIPGTTTDIVEKTMELLPVGPVVFLDTAGVDDDSELSKHRIKKTYAMFDRSDVFVLIVEPNQWTEYEEHIVQQAKDRNIPFLIVVNKCDIAKPSDEFRGLIEDISSHIVYCNSIDLEKRDEVVALFKTHVQKICPQDFLEPPTLVGDLLPPGGLAVFIVPIDLEAPKGRLILPQVQAIRDILDNDATVLVVKEREYADALKHLAHDPDLVVCDSQVVLKMIADTPSHVKCTTFSILFSRYKGDLIEEVKGVKVVERLQPNDKVLIAEACSHHAIEDDIGRVKMPRWIRQYVGGDLHFDTCAGRDYPDNLDDYKVIIHCGGCMITRHEKIMRIKKAQEHNIPITNYGICISLVQGVLERVLSPFSAALEVYKQQV